MKKHQSRQEWLEQECVFTRSLRCDACPYVVFDDNGSRKCEREMYENCANGIGFEERES